MRFESPEGGSVATTSNWTTSVGPELVVLLQPLLMRGVGQDDLHFGERLADFELVGHAGGEAEGGDFAEELHLGGEGFIDAGGVTGWKVAQVDGFGRRIR